VFGIDDILGAVFADVQIVALIMGAVYVLAFICAVREILNSRTSQGVHCLAAVAGAAADFRPFFST
jgi:hypothetical protein